MPTTAQQVIDLSDLDPYHSPKIFKPVAASPPHQSTGDASSSSSSTTPLPPPALPTKPVANGDDPLEAFDSLLSLSDKPKIPEPQAQQIAASDARRDEVLSDLGRTPWDLMSDEPASFMPSSSTTSHTAPVPIPHRPTARRQSRSGSSSFSPPRRLSGLMWDNPMPSTSSTSSPPPQHQSHPSDPTVSHLNAPSFHPNSPRLHAAESTMRLARKNSTSATPTSPSALSDLWSDFQSGSVETGSMSPELPSPSHSNSVPQVGDPLKAAYARQLAQGRGAASLPVNGKGKSAESASPPPKDWRKEWAYDASSDDAVHPIKLVGVRDGVRRVLDEDIAEAIRPSLPRRLKLSTKWTLIYSLDQHGISMLTMYERMKVGLRGSDSGIVIVVRDEHGSIFGAFVNEALKEQKTYYGDGTCFLWKATPFSSEDFRVGYSVKAFPWTGRNSYFILSEATYLSIGGGDGRHGLWVDSVFEKGFSSRSPCFANEPLTAQEHWRKGPGGADEAKFEVVQFECWAVNL